MLILFPGALGDFLCFLPTLITLAKDRAATLVAKPELLDLVQLPSLGKLSIDRREISDLFSTGAPLSGATRELLGRSEVVHSWTGHGLAGFEARLAPLAERVVVHAFRDNEPGEHMVDYYGRCAKVQVASPAAVSLALRYDDAWLVDFEQRNQIGKRGILVVHPGSGSRRKNWLGFPLLFDRVRGWSLVPVQVIGPAEIERGVGAAPIITVAPSLPQLAALLRRSSFYVGNDSGVSHLAGAVGARGLALFADTDPEVWAPRGGRIRVLRAQQACSECGGDAFCIHRLSVEQVIAALNDLHPPFEKPGEGGF